MELINKKSVLEEIKTISAIIENFDELNKKGDDLVWSPFFWIFGVFMMSMLSGLGLFMMSLIADILDFGLFNYFFETKENSINNFLPIVVACGLFLTCFFYVINEKQKRQYKDYAIEFNKKYNLNFTPDEKYIDNFEDFYNHQKKNFYENTNKVDTALKAIRDEDEDFIKFSGLIMFLTEVVTRERAERREIRAEASRRLGDPEEVQQNLMKITED